MAGGLAALLDDVAAMAKLAAANVDDVAAAAGRASAKAAGVVVDDTAVTPQYLQGVDPSRELPMIKRIALGSLRNKLIIILPILLLLSQFAPWMLPPLLILGGSFLCFEGAEKVYEMIRGHHGQGATAEERTEQDEDQVVSGAIRTDLILSAEIMVISMTQVAAEGFWSKLAVLTVVGVAITVLVYGVVALIVKMDDIGLALAGRDSAGVQRFGRLLVAAMPKVLSVIASIGLVAMLWVGGHLVLASVADMGWHAPFDLVHHLSEGVHGVAVVGPALAWVVETLCSLVFGLAWGGVILLVWLALPFGRRHSAAEGSAEEGERAASDPHTGG